MLKSFLKQIEFFYIINAKFKSLLYLIKTKKLQRKYSRLSKKNKIYYNENDVISEIKNKVEERLNGKKGISDFKNINVFWIGTNYDQDHSGLLQDLNDLCSLKVFFSSNGQYGFVSNIETKTDEIRLLNDKEIFNAVLEHNSVNKIDIIIGQMWSNYISPSLLYRFKDMGIIIINISMDDRLPEMWDKGKGTLGFANSVDLVLTTAMETCLWYKIEGIPAIYWPLASSASNFSPSKSKDIDISFIGNKYGYRSEIVTSLIDSGINIKAFGKGWDNGYINASQSGEVLGRSKISLGIGTIGYSKSMFTLKLRDFDVPMSGAMYITHRTDELRTLFVEDKEIVFYSTINELVEKATYYLNNPSQVKLISDNGRNRVLKDHTWKLRFERVFKIIYE